MNTKQLKERASLIKKIDTVNAKSFDEIALQIFFYQYTYNEVYREYVDILDVNPNHLDSLLSIPFLPIQFYKSHIVSSRKENESSRIFRSSTTTGKTPSVHNVYDIQLYHKSCEVSLLSSMDIQSREYQWIGLLPSYLEREDASLVEMVKYFNDQSKYKLTAPFFLDQYEALNKVLAHNKSNKIPTILVGVTFAILDWLETGPEDNMELMLIETGGMKGRRKEMTRKELHDRINQSLKLKQLSSEYGMTELMSQAYWKEGSFRSPKQMRIIGREITDPFQLNPKQRTVALNIVDLYNIDSCSFIATDDIGQILSTRKFKVTGRLDVADIRGCNLMVV